MTESKEQEKKPLTLSGKGTLSLKSSGGGARSGSAQPGTVVEVKRSKRSASKPEEEQPQQQEEQARHLTDEERLARVQALRQARTAEPKKRIERPSVLKRPEPVQKDKPNSKEDQRQKELEELKKIEEEERLKMEQANLQGQERMRQNMPPPRGAAQPGNREEENTTSYRDKLKKAPAKAPKADDRRRGGKLTVTQVLNEDYDRDRSMSLAAQRRAREKARLAAKGPQEPAQKVFREVVLPETITVQELANRMSERGADVIKELMKMGVMATINQVIDADTAELIATELGHAVKRVSESDIEEGLGGEEDKDDDMQPRPPVVTIMGHVDHGKTSLLDSLRTTDVVAGEAGGITQHIGAYQVTMKSGDKITFLDTPGHAAFTEMRARGANVTDIVVLVVAANDSIMPQTVEAINHAKAAEVPIIVAINKVDLPDAEPYKVKQDLLQYEVLTEDMGGDVQAIEVSALKKEGLDKLEEAILLQAEILELKANPSRAAEGIVVEAKMETGRGSVATVLIQRGTLKVGDIFAVGAEFGRVRALINDRGEQIEQAIPGQPVEVLGLNGTPEAGDTLNVVNDDARAREISEFRQRQKREKQAVAITAGRTFENMLAAQQEGEKNTLPVVIKGDVHGSVEAIIGSLNKMVEENDEIAVQVLHSGVGGITESDVTLARASNALIIGFNVRANAQARDQAQRDGVDMRYYNIIYNVIDDAKAILSGMLSPTQREEYLGQAQIREVFNISKVGKIAGCMVTLGSVKRGSKVRLLRDDVVIHEGMLKTLKRFKDEVKEVKEGMECGMAFESYDDIKENDIIECFEIIEEARQLD